MDSFTKDFLMRLGIGFGIVAGACSIAIYSAYQMIDSAYSLESMADSLFRTAKSRAREALIQPVAQKLDSAEKLNALNSDSSSRKDVDSLIRSSRTLLGGIGYSTLQTDSSAIVAARLMADVAVEKANLKADSIRKAQFADTTALFKRQLRVQSGKVQNKPQGQMPITPRSFL